MSVPERNSPLVWFLVSLPGIALVLVLIYTVFARLPYPYDLEWMEGGLLAHASRIESGRGIYVEPSIEFIPYLYTPLYPGLLAALGSMVGISYQLGRLISIFSMLGVLALSCMAVVRPASREMKSAAWAGAAIACGLFAATYPWVEGWYDIVRADTLFLVMAIGGLMMLTATARHGTGANGQLQTAAAAALLAFSFFAKQTGVFYVAIGGALLLVFNWRRVPVYVGVAGLIGLGGTWLMNRVTDGWFWTYVYEVHQSHDFHVPRVLESFGHILLRFPVMTVAVATALLAVGITTAKLRRLPPSSGPLLMWSFVFLCSTVVGAISWGTQWAHFNAFIPAMATGAIAAGTALPAFLGALGQWDGPDRPLGIRTSTAITYIVAGALMWQLLAGFWAPGRFIPDAEDRQAGDELIKTLAKIEGDVLVPYHPWYAHLAGKKVFTHRMGLLDMSVGKKRWPIRGMREAFRNHYFDAVILDNRPIRGEFAGLQGPYRLDELLGVERAPRVFTGAGAAYKADRLVPHALWVPALVLEPPRGVQVIENFEKGNYRDWNPQGKAWGRRPASRPVGDQGPVRRYGGRYFATSYHGGDEATGTMTSSEFEIAGNLITLRLSGGQDMEKLRAELVVGGQVVRKATATQSERMREVVWSVAPWRGERAVIRLVDRATGSWGHLNVDEIWMHAAPEGGD